jgi:hypothetical protein
VVAAVLAEPGLLPCRMVTSHTTLPAAGQHDGGFFAVLALGLPGSGREG